MTPRTPEERERMYALLWERSRPASEKWGTLHRTQRACWVQYLDQWLAAFPQLWDSLPPDPAEQARKEAEEDGRLLAGIQKDYATWAENGYERKYYPLWLGDALDIIGRMSARAAAGYPVLIAPKGE